MNRFYAAAVFLMLTFSSGACATEFVWPGPAPCDTTLTVCVNADAVHDDDTIVLSSPSPITETISVFKLLSLKPGPGLPTAVFAPGVTFTEFGLQGSSNITIQGLTFLNGYLEITEPGKITVRNLSVTVDTSFARRAGIYISDPLSFELANNQVTLNGSNFCAICATSAMGEAIQGSIHDNRVSSNGSNSHIGANWSGPNSTTTIYANQLRDVGIEIFVGSDATGSANIVSNAVNCVTPNSVYGISIDAVGSTQAHVLNNTIDNCSQGVELLNSVDGGQVNNNILVNNGVGAIFRDNTGATVSNSHNLLWNNAAEQFTPDATTILADPKFIAGPGQMRLSGNSPAVDTADSNSLTQMLTALSLASIDADGLRRFKGVNGFADIGAFEFGDSSFVQTSTGSEMVVDPVALGLGSNPQFAQVASSDTLANGHYYTGFKPMGGHLDLIREDNADPPVPGSSFDIFVPGLGPGQFTQITQPSNVFGFTTRITNPFTDGHPERIVVVTLDGPTTFDHPFATVYVYPNWYIQQLDAQTGDPDFPLGIHFNVYAQDPSLNAFIATEPSGPLGITLNHPVLNNEPCGRLIVGSSSLDAQPIDALYVTYTGTWTIQNIGHTPIVPGARFGVIVDEAGTAACRYDHLFHDNFDSPVLP